MKTLLLILTLFAVPAFAQNYKELGTNIRPGANAGIAYFIDLDSIQKDGDKVKFNGLIAAFMVTDEGREALPDYRLLSEFSANCKTKVWSEHTRKGKWVGTDGKIIIKDDKDIVIDKQAGKDDPISSAIAEACKEKGLRA